eukprot:gene9741-1945_t
MGPKAEARRCKLMNTLVGKSADQIGSKGESKGGRCRGGEGDCNVAVQLVCMQIAWDVDALHNGTDPNDEVCCGPERQERSFLGQLRVFAGQQDTY